MIKINKKFFKQIKFIGLHFLMISFVNTSCLMSIYANNIIPDNRLDGDNIILHSAGNGVPIVDINDPNRAGVSHNKFIDFNVGTNGVILNNSQGRSITQLGGFVESNQNLHHAASTIINEVTSTKQSNINGSVEIAGKAADYILANPNGISVNGVSFINAHKVTLTTGIVGLDSQGVFDNLLVEKGAIEFIDRETNGKSLDYFDVVSLVVKINAKVRVDSDLKITTGHGKYSAKTRQTNKIGSSSDANSNIAIDSTLVGGLYAGKITIISTEEGVGVNLPEIKTSNGDIEINASGDVVHKSLNSNYNIKVESQKGGISMLNNNEIDAQGTLDYKAKKKIDIGDGSRIINSGSIDIQSIEGKLVNKGEIIANNKSIVKLNAIGCENFGKIQSDTGEIQIDTKTGSFDNKGVVSSKSNNLLMIKSTGFSNTGKIEFEVGFIDIDAKNGNFLNKGKILSEKNNTGIKVHSAGFANEGLAKITAKVGDLNIVATNLTNQGELIANGLMYYNIGGAFSNTINSLVESRSKITINANNFTNNSVLKAQHGINIKTNTYVLNDKLGVVETDHDGIIIASQAGFVTNNGSIKSDGLLGVQIEGEGFENTNKLESVVSSVVINAKTKSIKNTGYIKSHGESGIKIDSFGAFNDGELYSKNGLIEINANTGEFINTKTVVSDSIKGIKIDSTGAFNDGELTTSLGPIIIDSKTQFLSNNGTIKSNSSFGINIHSNGLTNNKTIYSTGGIVVDATVGFLMNTGSFVSDSRDGLKIFSKGLMNDTEATVQVSSGPLIIDSKDGLLTNKGQIKSHGSFGITTDSNGLVNDGTIYSKLGFLDINGKSGQVINTQDIISDSLRGIQIESDLFKNYGKLRSNNSDLKFKRAEIINDGNIFSGNSISVKSDGDFTNNNEIISENELDLNIAKVFINSEKAHFQSKSKINITSDKFNNSGAIISLNKMNAQIKNNIFNTGIIQNTNEKILFNTESGSFINTGDITASGVGGLEITSEGFKNTNNLESKKGPIVINSGSKLSTNKGAIIDRSADGITIDSIGFINKGSVYSVGSIKIDSKDGFISNEGGIISESINGINIDAVGMANHTDSLIKATLGDIVINAKIGSLINKGAIKSNGENGVKIDSTGLVNGGSLKSKKGRLYINAHETSVVNKGGMFGTTGIDINSVKDFTNSLDSFVVSEASLKIDTNTLENDGLVSSRDQMILNVSKSLKNSGDIVSKNKDFDIKVADGFVSNSGNIIGILESKIVTKNNIKNDGVIFSDKLEIISLEGSLENFKKISSLNTLEIKAPKGKFYNKVNGIIETNANITMTFGDHFENDGKITAIGVGKIELDGNILNSGSIVAKGLDSSSNHGSFNNVGVIDSSDKLNINIANNIDNIKGIIKSHEKMKLTSNAGDLTNAQGKIISNKKISFNIANNIRNSGVINSDDKIDIINFHNSFNNTGVIEASRAIDVKGRGNFYNSNLITSEKTLTFNMDGNLNNNGQIKVDELIALNVVKDFINDKEVKSVKALNLDLSGNLINSGFLFSNDKMTLKALEVLNEGNIVCKDVIDLKAFVNITNNGLMKADLGVKLDTIKFSNNKDGKILSKEFVEVTVKESMNLGHIEATKNLLLTADKLTNDGRLIGSEKNEISTALELINQKNGHIEATNDTLTIKSDSELKNEGIILGGSSTNITIESDIDNKGKVSSAGVLNIQSTSGGIKNFDLIKSSATSTIKAKSNIINDNGMIKSERDMMFNSGANIKNINGTIYSKGKLDLFNSHDFANSGMIKSKKELVIKSKNEILNKGIIKSRDILNIISENKDFENNDGLITSINNVIITATKGEFRNILSDKLIDDKFISSLKGDLVINANTGIKNTQGHLESGNDLILTSALGGLTNSGNIISQNIAKLNFKDDLNNQGLIQAAIDLKVENAKSLENSGGISGKNIADLKIEHDIINTGIIQGAKELKLNSISGKITNEKIILTPGNLAVSAKGDILNQKNGSIISDGVLEIKSINGRIVNKDNANISSVKSEVILIANSDIINDSAKINANNNLTITSINDGITNNLNSEITSQKELILKAQNSIVNKSKLESTEKMMITSSVGSFVNEGKDAQTISFDALEIAAPDNFTNIAGRIEGVKDFTIKGSKLFKNTGEVLSGGKLQILRAHKVENAGHIQGNDLLKLDITNEIENKVGGVMMSSLIVDIAAGGDVNNHGNIQAENGRGIIVSKNANINNTGVLFFKGSALELDAKGGSILHKQGASITAKSLDLSAGSVVTSDDQIDVADTINIKKAQNVTNNHLIKSANLNAAQVASTFYNSSKGTIDVGSLRVNSPSFNNKGQLKLSGLLNVTTNNWDSVSLKSSGGANLTINGPFTNASALDFGQNDLTIHAHSIDNSGKFKARNITANSNSYLTNSGVIFTRNNAVMKAPDGITNNDSGYMIAASNLTLSSNKNITNRNAIFGELSLTLNAAGLGNGGEIKSNGAISVNATINNSNLIAGKNSLTLSGVLVNSGTLISEGEIDINTKGYDFTNNGSITSTYGNVNLTTGTFTNNNIIEALRALNVNSNGAIYNNHSIYGGNVVLKPLGELGNKGRIIARDSIIINTGNANIQNISDKTSAGEISVLGYGDLTIIGNSLGNKRNYDLNITTNQNLKFFQVGPSVENTVQIYQGGSFRGTTQLQRITKKTTYRDKLNSYDPFAPIISSNGGVNISVNGVINNSGGKIFGHSGVVLNGSDLSNEDIVSKEHILLQPRVQLGDAYWRGAGQWKMGRKKMAYIKNHRWVKEAASWKHNEIDNIPSIIQSNSSIRGNLSRFVKNGSGGDSNSNIPNPKSVNYAINNEPADVVINVPNLRVPNAIGVKQASINNITNSTLPIVHLQAASMKYPSTKNISLSENIASKAGQYSMETKALKKMVRNLINAYQPENRTNVDINNVPKPKPTRVIDNKYAFEVPDEIDEPTIYYRVLSDNDYDTSLVDISGQLPIENDLIKKIGVDRVTPRAVDWNFKDDPEIEHVVRNQKWHELPQLKEYYIKETSVIYTQLEKYFSTDNFIKRIPNYEPKKDVIHYGDPMKQMDLIRRQTLELTGLMSLEDGVDYVTQVHNLYESGIRAQQDLNLTPGVKLTKELANQLQENIVWPEIIDMGDKNVFIPRLYLAQKHTTSKAFGGIIAPEIDIRSGSFYNDGNIVGRNVSLQTTGDLINNGGTIFSSNHFNLVSGGDITNTGGGSLISHGTGYMEGNNIHNITKTHKFGSGSNYRIESGPISSIKVAGNLALSTKGNVVNRGGKVSVGSLDMKIGGSFVNDSIKTGSGIESSSNFSLFGNSSHYSEQSVLYKAGMIDVENNLGGMIGGDFGLIGSKLSVGGNSTLLIGGDTYMESQVNSTHVSSRSSNKSKSFLGPIMDMHHTNRGESYHENLAESELVVGKKSIMFNDGKQIFTGAKIESGDGLELKSSQTKFLGIKTIDYDSNNSSSKGVLWQQQKVSGHKDESFRGTQIVGGVLKMESGDIEVEVKNSISEMMVSQQTKDRPSFFVNKNKPQWALSLESKGVPVKWKLGNEEHKSWNESQSGLTKEGSTVVSIGAGVLTAWAGGFGATVGTGLSMGSVATTMMEAGAANMASRGAVSLINNRFDPIKTTKELTSRESLKDVGRGMVISGVTFGIHQGTGFGLVSSGMKPMERFREMGERGLINTGVRSLFTDEKPVDIFKGEFGSAMLAMGQSMIGDIGEKVNLGEGSIGKSVLHGTLGGMYSQVTTGKFGSGFIGGSMGEVFAPITSELFKSNSLSQGMTKLATSSIMFASGGDVGDIHMAGNVGESVFVNNFLSHLDVENLRLMEEFGIVPDGTTLDTIEGDNKLNLRVIDIGSDVYWIIAGGPQALIAKRTAVQMIKSKAKDFGKYISTKLSKVEKLDHAPTGKVMEYVPNVGDVIQLSIKSMVIKQKKAPSLTHEKLVSGDGIRGPGDVFTNPLLPNEGKVGSYGGLQKISITGDGLDIHHGPNDKYMRKFGIEKRDGISILVRESLHREIHKKLKNQNPNLAPREALAESVLRTREVYKENYLYLPQIREGLLEKIKQSKEVYPQLFEKNKN